MRRALITGLAGVDLSSPEREFLARTRPAGIILFARNCVSHTQIKTLINDARVAIGARDVLVLIDQEGGRVQRLRPPIGRALPPAAGFARAYADDPEHACQAAYLVARLLADDLTALGINCNCAPVLDVPVPGAHDIIGDRAYGTTPGQVVALGRAVAQGFIHGSILPVVKHTPGHGRATEDSHLALPTVTTPQEQLTVSDFAPFKALSDIPAAMTAHVVYSDIDPAMPASSSPKVINEIIRGEIGFHGLLMSDDLSMKALSGSISARAENVIRAGSDIALHCTGDLDEMEAAAAGVPEFGKSVADIEVAARFDAAIEITRGVSSKSYDTAAAQRALDEIRGQEVDIG